MGQAKNEMMRLDDLRGLAENVAARAGAVSPCEFHEDVLLSNRDPDADKRAYAIGTNMVKAGEVDGTRQEFMDAIDSVIEEAGQKCPSCAKRRQRD